MQAEAKIVLLGRYTADVTKVLVEAMIAEQVTVTNGAPALPPMRPPGSRTASSASGWAGNSPSPASTSVIRA